MLAHIFDSAVGSFRALWSVLVGLAEGDTASPLVYAFWGHCARSGGHYTRTLAMLGGGRGIPAQAPPILLAEK